MRASGLATIRQAMGLSTFRTKRPQLIRLHWIADSDRRIPAYIAIAPEVAGMKTISFHPLLSG